MSGNLKASTGNLIALIQKSKKKKPGKRGEKEENFFINRAIGGRLPRIDQFHEKMPKLVKIARSTS